MQYTIDGGNLPVLKVALNTGEEIVCEAGAMSWMDNGIEMQTQAGGLGKMLGKMLTKESMFENTYRASCPGEIAFAAKLPGSILAVNITPGNGIIIQKGSYLAHVGNIQTEVYLQKKLGNGLFGGEGFIMRKFTGNGIVFLEIDGSSHEYELQSNECKVIDTGYVAAMSETCRMEVRTVKGVANALFGGEGFFNTVVYGPGKVTIQSMPVAKTAMALYGFIPHS